MNDGLYIIIELGAGFAAIISFLVTFLSSFRRWVLVRIDRDIDPHLAKRDASIAKYARQARGGQASGRDGQRGTGGGTRGKARDPAPVDQAPRQPDRRWINEARSRIMREFVPLNAANANTIDRRFCDLRYNTDGNQKA